MASETTKWRNTGVFFDNVAVRFADGAAVRRTAVPAVIVVYRLSLDVCDHLS